MSRDRAKNRERVRREKMLDGTTACGSSDPVPREAVRQIISFQKMADKNRIVEQIKWGA